MSISNELLEKVERTERMTRVGRPLLVIGIIAVVAALLVLSLYLNNLREVAEQKRVVAEAARDQTADLANSTAATLEAVKFALEDGDIEQARELLDISIVQQEEAAEQSSAALTDPVARTAGHDSHTVRVPTTQLAPQVERALETKASTSETAVFTPAPQRYSDNLVYVHFAGALERTEIIDLQIGLKNAGWNVQGTSGERVKVAPRDNEVRYNPQDGASAATALAKAINAQGNLDRPVVPKEVPIVRRGVLEVWLSR